MVVEEATTYVDLLERVLDKGIVFDPWIRVSVAGIDLITVGTHVVVASIDTYLSSVAMSRVLFIVAADRPDLFEMWTAEFRDLAQGHGIVLDGRRAERRHQIQSVHQDRRRAERREHKINRELESVGLAVVATGLEGE